ncbi:hypothetical protein JCM10213_005096 [Rhodosporidiobolus nylandii]
MPFPHLPLELVQYISLFFPPDQASTRETGQAMSLVCRDWLPIGRRLVWLRMFTFLSRTTPRPTLQNEKRLAEIGSYISTVVVSDIPGMSDDVERGVQLLGQYCLQLKGLHLVGAALLRPFFLVSPPSSPFPSVSTLFWTTDFGEDRLDLSDLLDAIVLLPNLADLEVRPHGGIAHFWARHPRPDVETTFLASLHSLVDLLDVRRLELKTLAQPSSVTPYLFPNSRLDALDLCVRTSDYSALLPHLSAVLPTLPRLTDLSLTCFFNTLEPPPFTPSDLSAFFSALPSSLASVKTGFNLAAPGFPSLATHLATRTEGRLREWRELHDVNEDAHSVVLWRKEEDERGRSRWTRTEEAV